MSHPTLSGFFPTQTYLVPFIFRTNLQINNWFIAFCWACLQFAEAFLPAASRAHPSLVAAPMPLSVPLKHTAAPGFGEKNVIVLVRGWKNISLAACVSSRRTAFPRLPPPVTTATSSRQDKRRAATRPKVGRCAWTWEMVLPGDRAGSARGCRAVSPSQAKPSTRLPLPPWGFFCHR